MRDYRVRSTAQGTLVLGGSAFNVKSESGHLIVFDRSQARTWGEKIFGREAPADAGAPVTVWGR